MGKPNPDASPCVVSGGALSLLRKTSLVPAGVGAGLQSARRPQGGWEAGTRIVSVALSMLLAVTMLPAGGLSSAFADEPVERPATSGGDVALSSTNGAAAAASQAPVAETREDGMHVADGLVYTVADGGLSLVGFDGEATPEGALTVPAAVMLDGKETPVVAIDLAEGQAADKVTILALPQSIKDINTASLASALPGLASVEVAAAAGSSLPVAAGAASMRAAYSASGGMVFRPASVDVQGEDGSAETVECKELVWAPPALTVARIPVECRAIAEGAFASVRDLKAIVAFGTMARIAEGALTSEQIAGAKVVVPNESPAVVDEGTERVSASMALMNDEGQMERRRPWHEAGFASESIVMGKPYGSLTETVAVTPEGAIERPDAMLVSYPGMHPEATDVKHPGEDGKIDMAESGLAFTVKSDMTASVAWQGDKTATPSHIEIPASVSIDGVTYPVTEIAAGAFEGAAFLTSVAVPEGVVSVGENAFADCDNLREISLPSTLKEVGSGAIAGMEADSTVAFAGDMTTQASEPVASPTEEASPEDTDGPVAEGGEGTMAPADAGFVGDADGNATVIGEAAPVDSPSDPTIASYATKQFRFSYTLANPDGTALSTSSGSWDPQVLSISVPEAVTEVGFLVEENSSGGRSLIVFTWENGSWENYHRYAVNIAVPASREILSFSVLTNSWDSGWKAWQTEGNPDKFIKSYPATANISLKISCGTVVNSVLKRTTASLADLTAYAPLAFVYNVHEANSTFAKKDLLSTGKETAFTNTNTVRGAIDAKADADHEHDAADVTSGTFGTDRLADAAVTAAKLASDSVETAKIKDENVTTDKLADKNVTTDKLADKAVTADKLAEEYAKASDFGTIAYSGLDESDMSVYPTSYRKGGAPSLPKPEAPGKRFTGWTWSGHAAPTTDPNEIKAAFADGDKTVTLTANWTAPEATYFFTEDKPLDPTATGAQEHEIFVKLSDTPGTLRKIRISCDNSLGLLDDSAFLDDKILYYNSGRTDNWVGLELNSTIGSALMLGEHDGAYGLYFRLRLEPKHFNPSAFPSSLVSGSSVLECFQLEYELA